MPSNDREARRLQRQRGAGVNLQNINFGFTFGGPPLPAQRSSRKTPQPLAPRPSSRGTPQPLSTRLSSRKTPTAANAEKGDGSSRRQRSTSASVSGGGSIRKLKPVKTPREKAQAVFVTPTVIGKRKRGQQQSQASQDDEQDELEQNDAAYMASSQKSGSVRAKSSNLMKRNLRSGDIPDELESDGGNRLISSGEKRQQRRSKSLEPAPIAPKASRESNTAQGQMLHMTPAVLQEHITEPAEGISTPVQRQGRSGKPQLSASQNRSERHTVRRLLVDALEQSSSALQDVHQEVEDVGELSAGRRQGRPQKAQALLKYAKPSSVARDAGEEEEEEKEEEEEEEEEEADELSPDKQEYSRTKRKQLRHSKSIVEDPSENDVGEPQEVDELSPEANRTRPVVHRVSSPSVTSIPVAESDPEYDLDEVDEEPREQARGRGLPAQGKASQSIRKRGRPTQKAFTGSSSQGPVYQASSPDRKKRRPRLKGATIPIKVYRLSHPKKHSGKESQAVKDDASFDAYSSFSSFNISGVSAVDVLAQITEETLTNRILFFHQRAENETNSAKRSELKRKRGVLKHFNNELNDHFLTLRDAVDADTFLKNRLKKTLREKIRLREEFLSVRKQRDELAVQKDQVREDHKVFVKSQRERDEINANLFDIEAVIQQGREKAKTESREDEGPDIPLEMALEGFGKDISSSGNGGLLEKVKAFNGVLKKTAEVFERRV